MQPTTTPPIFLTPDDLAVQARIRLPLPVVKSNKDYQEKEALLKRMDEILVLSGVQQRFVEQALMKAHEAAGGDGISDRKAMTVHRFAIQSLRCTIARILSNESHRVFSSHLAESALLQWFCHCENLPEIKVPTKSTLQRMETGVPKEIVDQLNHMLLNQAASVNEAGESPVGLAEEADLSMVWMDATCAPLDIHYPTDWSLLRDGTRSIMRAILVIRKHGLCHRMPAPEKFIAMMNKQAMAMCGASRRGRGGDKKRARKKILRAMKKVAKKVMLHGQRYRDLLEKHWEETDLSQKQAQQIIDRLDRLVKAMPEAIHQAHERIIGGRMIANDEKILSLYEPQANVYVRGKSGADVEIGLQMLLTESAEGLIVDCQLVKDGVANDSTLLIPAIQRIREVYGDSAAKGVVTDRGFSSKANSETLEDMKVMDVTLPRDPKAMEEFLSDPINRKLHCRRAQTEARIGIFKANFLGDHLPSKGFDNQCRYVAWATLAHNIWVLARLERSKRCEQAA